MQTKKERHRFRTCCLIDLFALFVHVYGYSLYFSANKRTTVLNRTIINAIKNANSEQIVRLRNENSAKKHFFLEFLAHCISVGLNNRCFSKVAQLVV